MNRGVRAVVAAAFGVLALTAVSAQVRAENAGALEIPRQIIEVELVVAAGVEDREPVGVADTFPADVGQVYAWMRVTDGADQALEVEWSHGENSFVVPLEIGGSPWRTWSSKTIPPEWAGPWTVVVRDLDGNTLAEANFTVG